MADRPHTIDDCDNTVATLFIEPNSIQGGALRKRFAAAQRGKSWTQASLDAGFADAAHFTRTCRRVFGIAPTMLIFEREI